MSITDESDTKRPDASGTVAPAGLQLYPVGFGQPARQTLQQLIAEAKAGDPLAPVTVITTDGGGISLQRQLTEQVESGLIAVSAKVLSDVAEYLLERNPRWKTEWLAKRGANDMMLRGVVRKVLEKDDGLFAKVRHHPATEESLLNVAKELSDLDDGQLDQVEQCSPRAAAVVDLYRRLQKELTDNNLYMRLDVFRQAVDLLSSDSFNATAVESLGTVVVYLPIELKAQQAEFLKALAERVSVHVIAGVTGDAGADKLYHRLCDRLGLDAEQPLAEQLQNESANPPVGDQIVSVSDPDDEVRWVVRAALSDLADGIPAEQVAILYPVTTPYARLVGEQLDRAEINWHGNSARRLSESAVGHFAAGFADLVGTDMPRAAFFEVIAGGSVLNKQASNKEASGELVPAFSWERTALTANVIAGDDWDIRLKIHIQSLKEQLEDQASEEDDSETWIEAKEREESRIERCEQLRRFAMSFKKKLDLAADATTWTEFCSLFKKALKTYLNVSAGHKPRGYSKWPGWQRDAGDAVLTELEKLEELAPIEENPRVQTMCQALSETLRRSKKIHNPSGEGIYVGLLDSGVNLAAARVYVLGMTEGTCPTRHRPNSMIIEEERQLMGGALLTAADAILKQHHDLLAVLSGIKSQQGFVTLLCPRGDLRESASNVPSRWLLDTAQVLEQEGAQTSSFFENDYIDEHNLASAASHEPSIPNIIANASFTGGLLTASFPATHQEYDSAELLLAAGKSRDPYEIIKKHELCQAGGALELGIELTSSRNSRKFTRFDGNLKEVNLPEFNGPISASGLESWAKCPRAFFFKQFLKVSPVEEPASLLHMSPLKKGNIIHLAIDQFLKSLLSDGHSPGPEYAYTDADEKKLVALVEELFNEAVKQGLGGHPFYAELDCQKIKNDMLELLSRDKQRGFLEKTKEEKRVFEHGKLLATEHHFGRQDLPDNARSADLVEYKLENEKVLKLRGSIDRVELLSDKADSKVQLSVIDYKTGKPDGYKSKESDPTLGGTLLQPVVYAIAATDYFRSEYNLDEDWSNAVGQAVYWFITSKTGKWKVEELKLKDSRGHIDSILSTIQAGITKGIFPGHLPTDESRDYTPTCSYCSPDSLSTSDLEKQWKSKREDSDFSEYADLAEGLKDNSEAVKDKENA